MPDVDFRPPLTTTQCRKVIVKKKMMNYTDPD